MKGKKRGHSVMVPDGLWRKFQWRSGGMTNPGPFIRECLFDWISNEEEQESLIRQFEQEEKTISSDPGRIWKLKYRAICQECGEVMLAETEAVIATVEGKRIYRHVDHLIH